MTFFQIEILFSMHHLSSSLTSHNSLGEPPGEVIIEMFSRSGSANDLRRA